MSGLVASQWRGPLERSARETLAIRTSGQRSLGGPSLRSAATLCHSWTVLWPSATFSSHVMRKLASSSSPYPQQRLILGCSHDLHHCDGTRLNNRNRILAAVLGLALGVLVVACRTTDEPNVGPPSAQELIAHAFQTMDEQSFRGSFALIPSTPMPTFTMLQG